MEAAMKTIRNLEIDGMSGDACVQKVNTALKGVPNVTTTAVKVGSATITADQAGSTAAVVAVNGAGYKARESLRTGSANGTPHTTPAQTPSQTPSQTPTGKNAAAPTPTTSKVTEDPSTSAAPATPAVAAV